MASDDRVVKEYIEDDREMRRQNELNTAEQDNDSEDDSEETPERKSMWSKIFHTRKKVVGKIDMTIDKRMEKTLAMIPKVKREPFVALGTLNSSSIDMTVRVWTRSDYYWGLYFDMNERFYNELPKHGLNFPFPQMDVHLKNS